jgi:hypothetical protein
LPSKRTRAGADPGRTLGIAVKARLQRDQVRPLGFIGMPHALPGKIRMRLGSRPLQATFLQPLVEFGIVFDLRTGNEETAANGAHLVLHLTLLPTGRRRARRRLEQIMGAQLAEAVVEVALLAGEHLVHHRLQVVVDPPAAYPSEELEAAHVGIKDHLLGLARVGHHQKVPTVAQAQVRYLHLHRHPGHLHPLVAPVELKGFPGIKHQRDKDLRDQAALPPAPIPYMPPNAVIAARVALGLQLLKEHDAAPTLASGKLLVLCQRLLQTLYKCPQDWPRLRSSSIAEGRLLTAHRLAHGVAGNAKLFGCLADRLAVPVYR